MKRLSLKAHRGQRIVLTNKRRFRVVVAGRRWGKTQVSKIAIIRAATRKQNQLVWYVAPTQGMARQLMWKELKRVIPRSLILPNGVNETRMTIELVNGSTIELKGADNPDSLRGVGLDFLVLDEVQDMKAEVWEEVLRPTLSDTGGQALFIGTPKAFNFLYDLYQLGQRGEEYEELETGKLVKNDWMSWQFPTKMSPFIPRAEIKSAKRDLDKRSFNQEYNASFETMSGRVYYAFDRNRHVGDYKFNPKLPIILGMDFNIDPMSCVIMQEQTDGEIWVVDEAILPASNTEEAGNEVARRYHRHLSQVTVYPDPAGNNRSHGRGESDIEVLRDCGYKRIYFKRKHPPVQDRVNAVNRLLMNAEGDIRLRFNRTCKITIEAMEQTIYKPGTKEVDKKMGVEHPADALGYYCEYAHPVKQVHIVGTSN